MPGTSEGFYHLDRANVADAACCGTACFVAKHRDLEIWHKGKASKVHCLGKCYAAPASAHTASESAIYTLCDDPILTPNLLKPIDSLSAFDLAPEQIVGEVEASRLRGRGGAGFPTGRKMRLVRDAPAPVKYVVTNADEGDSGAYIDRTIMERDPFGFIDGLILAMRAVGATKGFVYLRAEYPQCQAPLRRAIDSQSEFEIEIVMGKGSYVCGEETAMLNSMEGKRPEVRVRPPFPGQSGLWGAPTLVNNVETIYNLPWIAQHGGEAYAQRGFNKSRGTKLLSLNSLFAKPGLYEVEFGTPLSKIIASAGGVPNLKGALIGGPLAGVVHPNELGTPLGFEELAAIGASVGHGGAIAFDDKTSIRELALHIMRFGADESCGKCLPCHLGAPAAAKELANGASRARLIELAEALKHASLCGHGGGLGDFLLSVLHKYPEEFAA